MEENKLYVNLLVAEEEEDRVLAEIDQVLKSTPDRGAAERIILEKYAPLMDKAMQKSREALDKWLATITAIV